MSTPEQGATPRPWRVSKFDGRYSIVAEGAITIAPSLAEIDTHPQANAALIVKAVNAHDALVAALYTAKAMIRLNARDEAQDDEAWKRFQENSPGMKEINAALKAAEEELTK